MALTIGDGPNRGKSAPPPRNRPLPKPKPDRPRTVADALGGGRGNGFSDRAQTVLHPTWQYTPQVSLHPPALAPRSKDSQRAYNRAEVAPAFHKAQTERVSGMYQAMADRQKKDDARLQREAKDRSETDKVMTAEEWVSLSPLQQAAAQANYDLSRAIAKDFKDQTHHSANSSQKEGGTERVQKYMAKVEDLFGKEGSVGFKGLEFAPNTLAFLESRGIDTKEDLGGRTLDDIVSGDALIDEETFNALGKPTANDARARNVTFAKSLAQGQLEYQEQLAHQLKRGDALLTDITGRGTNARAGQEYGAKLMPTTTKLTAVRPEMKGQIDKYMEILARPDIPLDESLSSIRLDLSESSVSKQESAQIWENMIERTRLASTGEAQWFDDVDFEMRSPLDVAKILGAPTLKRAGAK